MSISTYSELKNRINFSILPFTFSEEYANFIKHQFGNEVIYFEKNKIVVPLEISGRSFFQQIKLLAPPYHNERDIEAEELKSFLNDLQNTLEKSGDFMRIVQPHPMAFTSEKPSNSSHCQFGTYITHLQNKSDDDLLNEFDVKYKKAVQHSIKNGGTVIITNDSLKEFYSIYLNTCKRATIYYDSLTYFKNIITYLPDNTITAIINDAEGITIGAAFFIFDKHTCYCTHAGSLPGSKLYGGMKQLHFEMMKWMRDKNVKQYDLTGVRINSNNETLQGIFKFKKGFGGELKQGYLWKADLIKWKCLLYDLLVLIKSKGKKHKDIIDQEL
jgi:hypothetical protein